ncbi:transcription factor IIIB [Rhynchospora pubera]|uniref:Transcription factor IIIB n=1 Tax=Rhynchospora pubera TaxID=906938 RepID=A0AAV8CLC4_9POAL|nr:transcription factor IIIB [Rhynchospora pubera]KAJ4814138.1 transcription factor IIIB [Rhynchospora pubera]
MNKLLEYGRKAWFIVRVMSGYEERRIRAYRLHLQDKIRKAQAKREEVKKLPEQVILSEVRRMVEEMQGLNRLLEETEAKIEEHFKPIDEAANRIINLQMEKEERRMKEMMKIAHEQAMMQREATMRSIMSSNQQEINRSGLGSEDPAQQAQEQKK